MADNDKMSILVVDDLPEKLLVYQSILEELDQNVLIARTGGEALKLVLQHDFAVILLDVHMPGMDGLETAELIRKRKRSSLTPIIFVTAYLDDLRAVEAYAHGAVDYIMAPVAPEILRAKIKVFIDLFRMHEQVKRQAEERVVLAEERAKRTAAEEGKRHSAFLAEASAVLANSLDVEGRLRGLARVVVPFLADLSIVRLVDEQGRPNQTEWAWTDLSSGITIQPAGDPPSPPEPLGLVMDLVLKTGKPEVLEHIETPGAEQMPGPNGRPSIYPKFSLQSAAVLPLGARGKTCGVLALALGKSGRTFNGTNLALAEDLAGRAGIAIDNALLIRDIQEGDRRKDEFLAMLGHELRNPLAPICNAVQLMRFLGPPDPQLQEAREVIDRQLRKLTRLVDDLLDVSRITSGKIRLILEPVDVAAAVNSAVETSRPLIEARRHLLHVLLPSAMLRVKADLARLSQVLSNLLNNAAKYTEEGGRIWLTVGRETNDVVFRVRDTGAGIPPDILPRVFDLFTQADQALDRSQGGLGIGLTLVHRLVEMHKGRVQAFSQGLGQGSEFVVRLPALVEELPRVNDDNDAAVPPCSRCRVLVVDDNVDTAESLAMLIRHDGHEVQTAHDGLAALEASQIFNPEVVLLDIGLPRMDGYEVARRLRQQPQGNHVFLAAITGYDQEEDHARSQLAGFDQHLVKPVRLDALRRLLASRYDATSFDTSRAAL